MEKEEIIKRYLGETATIEKQMMGGMMNGSYLVNFNNKKYILYMPTEQANEMVDRVEEKRHLNIVYPLGITSKNVYFNEKTGVKINEFIEGNSINNLDNYKADQVADILRKLHESGLKSNLDYMPFERLEGYEKEALSFGPLSQEFEVLKTLLMSYKDYLLEDPLVLSHNDYQKSNIVYNPKEDKSYMIDFEFMANNSPIYDIACFANNNVEDGLVLLKAYFGNPTVDETKKFYLWRIFVSLQWYLVAIIKHYRKEGEKHHFNFLDVAQHFINIAEKAKQGLLNINY